MKRRNPTIYKALKRRRKSEGITQLALAKEIGCKQSAISMMEAGNLDALSEDKLQKIAEKLGVELDSVTQKSKISLVNKYCPNHDCPSNIPYVVAGDLCFMPKFVNEMAETSSRCEFCGEILQHECSNEECNAIVSGKSSCCNVCGDPYVECHADIVDKVTWADGQRERIEQIRVLIDS
ncbi:MAG: helix-turn-helix transcriptional regulator [Kiritimatiellae bacterium]|jgi:transcriptional regulator with XRE-family HTH domain|nr:helix-turn-helix transcriptional regulator [Kiritimatiellia bacterium]